MTEILPEPAPCSEMQTVRPGRRPNAELRPREHLFPHEIEAMRAAVTKANRYGHRDATLLLVAFTHGLRISEVCKLKWDRITLDTRKPQIAVRRAKGGDDGVHPLSGDEQRALRRLQREQMPASEYVFTTERGLPFTRDGLAKLIKRAGIAAKLGFPVHFHMLRHACGALHVDKGHDIRLIQGWLGHRSITSTTRYTAVSPAQFKGWVD